MKNVILIGDKELKIALKSLGTRGTVELKREIKRTSIGIENHYRRNVKNNFDTGELNRSIKHEVSGTGLNATIGSDVAQAVWIEFGTKAHIIEPKSPGGVLKFEIDGETVFAKKVQHPGTKANPGLLRAWLNWMIGDKFANRLKKRFEKIR